MQVRPGSGAGAPPRAAPRLSTSANRSPKVDAWCSAVTSTEKSKPSNPIDDASRPALARHARVVRPAPLGVAQRLERLA